MQYNVLLSKRSKEELDMLPKYLKEKCRIILAKLENDPLYGKPLSGDLHGCRSIRMSSYRIIYQIKKADIVILVVSIRHRKDVYRNIK